MRRLNRRSGVGTGRSRGLGVIPVVLAAAMLGTGAAVLVAIVGGRPGGLDGARTQLMEDLAFARETSMQGRRAAHLAIFDVEAQRYHVAAASDPETPVVRPDGTPCRVDLNESRWQGVTMRVTAMGDDERVGFGGFGQLDQRGDAVVRFATGDEEIEVRVSARDGRPTWNPLGPAEP